MGENQFKVGDTVQLKSGESPLMIVISCKEKQKTIRYTYPLGTPEYVGTGCYEIVCRRYNPATKEFSDETFPPDALKKLPPESSAEEQESEHRKMIEELRKSGAK